MSDEEREVDQDDLAEPMEEAGEAGAATVVTTGEESEYGTRVPTSERITVIKT